jgi:hypothetical protein
VAYSPEFIRGLRKEIFEMMKERKVSFLVARNRVLGAHKIISSDWSEVCSLVARRSGRKKVQSPPTPNRPPMQNIARSQEPLRRNRAENGFQPDD